MIIQVVSPKQALNTSNPLQIAYEMVFHRVGNKHDIAHNPIKAPPTVRASAPLIKDNNSVTKVIAPIAINTKQNITGARPIYISMQFDRVGGLQLRDFPRLLMPIASMIVVLMVWEVRYLEETTILL